MKTMVQVFIQIRMMQASSGWCSMFSTDSHQLMPTLTISQLMRQVANREAALGGSRHTRYLQGGECKEGWCRDTPHANTYQIVYSSSLSYPALSRDMWAGVGLHLRWLHGEQAIGMPQQACLLL
jgi:hypothetical protein